MPLSRPASNRLRAGASSKSVLFSIGYEQTTLDAVIAELNRAGVRLVVDVRAVAASRKPGFSKRQLAAALDEAGIAYLHLRDLGTPAEGRLAARRGDIARLRRIYGEHLRTVQAREAIDELAALASGTASVAILCYCRDPEGCHRLQIVDMLDARIPLQVRHLVPPLV